MAFDLVKAPLAAGRGVDRGTGLVATQPQYPLDAQNVYARDGKMALRPGLANPGYAQLEWGTDIIDTVCLQATGDQLFVVFDRDSREIRLFRLDVTNNVMQALAVPADGLWGVLEDLAPFPVVTHAEQNGLMFFAHSEAIMTYRLPTIYYTPDFVDPSNPGELTELEADLAPDGSAATVYFRGVYAYLEYIVGWGYGDESDDDRPEVLRLSVAGEPLSWLPGNYFLCGVKKDPILTVIATDGILAIGKANAAYRLYGTSGLDFGIDWLDRKYGVVSARAAIAVGTLAYWWSNDGPRIVTSAGTRPIGQPLELISPLPADLPPLGVPRTMFTVYDRDRYLLEFVFPRLDDAAVRTTSVALSLWVPDDPRWAFNVRERCLGCAGELYLSGDNQLQAPTGYASDVDAVDVGIATDHTFRRVSLAWVNNSFLGDEVVQVFAKEAGGEWAVVFSVPVGDDMAQSTNFETLLPLRAYELALRYVRGPRVTLGYEGADPDLWTAATAAGSKTTFNTSSAAPVMATPLFTSPSGPIAINWTSDQTGGTYLVEKYNGAAWETVAADVEANTYSYTIPGPELGTTVPFRITAKRGAIVGPVSASTGIFMGVTVGPTSWVSATWNLPVTNIATADLVWASASGATSYLLEKNSGVGWTTVATVAGTAYNYKPAGASMTVGPWEANVTVQFRVTPKNGAYSGPVSPVQLVTFSLTALTITSLIRGGISLTVTWTAESPTAVLRRIVASGTIVGPLDSSPQAFSSGGLPNPAAVTLFALYNNGAGFWYAPGNTVSA